MHSAHEREDPGLSLHQRLVAGDLTASAELAELYLPILTDRLERIFPHVDDAHSLDTAVEDAILNYIEKPSQYNPEKLKLESYLVMSAKWDLINILASQKKDFFVNLAEIVELIDDEMEHGIELIDPQDVEEIVLNRLSLTWKKIQSLLPDLVDQEITLALMEGIRKTEVYAEILNIGELTIEEQRKIVKRNKDRIKKILTRHINPAELKND
jgi:hypothetical protein